MAQGYRIHLLMKEMQEMRFAPWIETIPLEEEMAAYSSILAKKIPWTEEPGRLQSIGAQRVGQD